MVLYYIESESLLMIKDGHGEMGFMESMVSMMAVMIVIGLYLVFVTSTVATASSPLEELDPEAMVVDSQEGPTVSSSYAYTFMMKKDLKGLEVSLTVPWYKDTELSAFGELTEAVFEKRYVLMADLSNGRVAPMILEVRASI